VGSNLLTGRPPGKQKGKQKRRTAPTGKREGKKQKHEGLLDCMGENPTTNRPAHFKIQDRETKGGKNGSCQKHTTENTLLTKSGKRSLPRGGGATRGQYYLTGKR